MSLRTPLGRVRGLGSAKEGPGHWWAQRVSAVALVPLVIWFGVAMATATSLDYATLVNWLQRPINAIATVLLLLALTYHAKLGLQVVIEDYVHGATKVVSLVLTNLVSIVLAVAGVFAVFSVSIG